jgi:hypothetical protein
MSSIETVITIVVVMAYSVGRQIAGEPLYLKRLVGLPTALTVIGIVDVASSKGAGPTRTDIVLILAGCAINAVIGMCQGRLMRLESRKGYLWGQMPKSVLWWWAAKIGSGLILDGIGHALGAGLAVTTAVMLLRLGVNRLGQAAIVTPRAFATGIPFAPEPTKQYSNAARAGQFFSNRDGLLAEVAHHHPTFFHGEPHDLPGGGPVQRQQVVRPTNDDGPGYRTGTPDPFAGSSTRPTNLKRQVAQVLLREIEKRMSDTAK